MPRANTAEIRLLSFREQNCSTAQPKGSSWHTTIYRGAISCIPPGPLVQGVAASWPGSCPAAPRRCGASRASLVTENTSKGTTALLLLYHQGIHSLHSPTAQLTWLMCPQSSPQSQGTCSSTHPSHLGTRTSSLPARSQQGHSMTSRHPPCLLLANNRSRAEQRHCWDCRSLLGCSALAARHRQGQRQSRRSCQRETELSHC